MGQKRLRILVALEDPEDRSRVEQVLSEAGSMCAFAADIRSIDAAVEDADVVLADTGFANGALADWLSLWPVPSVLIVNPDFGIERLATNTVDEASLFIVRDQAGAWVRFIPTLVRKTAAIREALDRQNTNVIRTESSYMNLLRAVPDIVYVLDGDGFFVYLNDAVSQLGWKPSELIGKHFAEIVHPDDVPEVGRSIVLRRFEGITTGPEAAPKLFDERRSGDRMTRGLDVRLRHKEGIEWTKANVNSWGEVSSLGVDLPEFQGRGTGTIGLIHDISERRELERAMERELDSRSLLLKEIHHRVKNNMQVVSSLLSLESDCVDDEHAKAVFTDCQTQVQSMAMVHEQIYRGGSYEGVEAGAYFARLAEYLADVHEARMRGIRLSIEAGNVVLPLDTAMPLSIITTELISNAFKHAFPGERVGSVAISLSESDGDYVFTVADDGVGFASRQAEVMIGADGRPKPKKHKGIGMDLIEALANQLGGTLTRTDQGGTTTVIRFPARVAT
ncbi:MAG TPA: histidine kinase dimerization/phosphoacceptor domain -containing protein [bacterium]|nr:histidine kinase dimerization/phosphoacceptor domain -containing protein [bacterium]